jgi:UPF0755 protein
MLKFLRLLAWSFISIATAIALLGGVAYWLYNDSQAPGPLAETQTLVLPAHTGVAGIADLLAREGVIRNKYTFEAIAELSGRGKTLKPGEYEFPASITTMQTLDLIAEGRTVKHRLTIPEGLTSPEVIALLAAAPALEGDAGAPPPEGSLFPDTYVYSYGESRKTLVMRMQRAMTQIVAEIWNERRSDLLLTSPHDAVTLAAIVEKETARPEERAHVAGVYINRLRLGMRLQADPTVLFALRTKEGDNGAQKLDRPLAHADLSFDSPYNTYMVKGLPPGPIANPGKSALRAAVRPERTEDLYFVADGSGGHIFAKTLADQTHNIAQYQRGAALEPEPMSAPLDLGADSVPPPARIDPSPARRVAGRAPDANKRTAEQTARLRHCRPDATHSCPHLR